MSLEDDTFCTISFMPWQEKLFEYSDNISNEMEKMNQKMMDEDMPPKDMKNAMTRASDMGNASLLSQIIFEATRNLDDNFLKNSELVKSIMKNMEIFLMNCKNYLMQDL